MDYDLKEAKIYLIRNYNDYNISETIRGWVFKDENDLYKLMINFCQHQCDISYNKTPLTEWDKIEVCSARLRTILLRGIYDRELDKDVLYIEDVNQRNFLMQRNAGSLAWSEFKRLRDSIT